MATFTKDKNQITSEFNLLKNLFDKTKEKLPEGWTRRGCEEYNGLYCYYNNGKIQWKHPSE